MTPSHTLRELRSLVERDVRLGDNTLVGRVAELHVARALGGEVAPHPWAHYDVRGHDGRLVAVKSAMRSPYGVPRIGPIGWGGIGPSTPWDPVEGSGVKAWWAQVWAFTICDGDPMDGRSWSAYLVNGESVAAMSVRSCRERTLLRRVKGLELASLEGLRAVYDAIRPSRRDTPPNERWPFWHDSDDPLGMGYTASDDGGLIFDP